MSKDSTDLAIRMKEYEQRHTGKFMSLLPVLCRIDGRSFHTFTAGLDRPYDIRLCRLMIDTAKFLVQETNACCSYTQSDEISLVWFSDCVDSQIFFDGKISKIISVVASLATAYFNKLLPERLPGKAKELAIFDNRAWQVPTRVEAANYFVWREIDAVRNSIQMAARSAFTHTECNNKNTSDLQEMLWSQRNINWNDYPSFFRRGTYVRRRVLDRKFTPAELDALPLKHHARLNPELTIRRTSVIEETFPPLTKITNRESVILDGADPLLAKEAAEGDER